MGWNLASDVDEICDRAAAQLVSAWCDRHDRRQFSADELYDRQGSIDFPPDVVAEANRLTGWVPDEDADFAACGGDDEGVWVRARNFLEDAAACGSGLSGSY